MGKKLIIPNVDFSENEILFKSLKITTANGESMLAKFYRKADTLIQGMSINVESGVLTAFPKSDAANKHLDAMFYKAEPDSQLKSLSLKFDDAYSLNNAFRNNIGLELARISGRVTDFMQCFGNCQSLQTIILINCDLSDCSNVQNAFSGTAITSIDLTPTNLVCSYNASDFFSHCKNLRTITIPSNAFNRCKLLDFIFAYCDKLEVLNLGIQDFGSVTTMTDWLLNSPVKSITGTFTNIGKNLNTFGFGNMSKLDALSLNILVDGLYNNSGNSTKKQLYVNSYTNNTLTAEQKQAIADKNWEIKLYQ